MLRSLLLLLWAVCLAAQDAGVPGGCRMAYMSPRYIHVNGMDERHSRLASKYTLHLYREGGWDEDPVAGAMSGIPVLFVPGNAGSAHQIRSIAAAAARSFYAAPGRPREDLWQRGVRNLDFFAVDFNEDFSAFHGETLIEQMEYVCDALRYLLALYKQSAVAEASTAEAVILIGHSMGGLVARGVFNHPNYPANSVNTVITLSTPHVQPPAPFSRHLERIYADTNEFWRASFAAAPNLLAEVSILSIAGGTSDSMIDSDTTHLDGIAPQTNCLSVFTTTVPELYSTVDHLAIMWCDQLRNRVAQALLDVVAVSNPSRTKSVQERLAAWRRLFLSGLPVDVFDHQTLEAAVPLVERGPSVELPMAGRFVALSSSDFQVQTCKSGTCSLHPATVRPLPASYRNRPTSNMAPPFWTTSFETTGPSSLHSADSAPSFVMAHPLPEDAILLRWTLLGLLLFQHQFSVPRELALGSTFRFPLLASSLVVYRVYVLPRSCEHATRFAPMMQASSPISNEHHYFPNVSDAAVHIHAYPPFQYPAERSGLVLTFWFDPLCGEDLAFVLSMDIRKTLWTSLKRYRLILAAWPAALVMAFIHEQHSGVLHNGRLAQSFAKSSWSNAMRHNGILCLAATAQAVAVATFPAALGRHPLVRDMLLGTHQAVFIMLIPVLYIVALSAAVLTASILQMALLILNALKSRLPTMRKRTDLTTNLLAVAVLCGFVLFVAPYQFALLVVTLLGLLSTPIGLKNQSILLLLLLLLPSEGPILVVWARNLGAGWWQPFSSDHNVFLASGSLMWLVFQVSDESSKKLPASLWLRLLERAQQKGWAAGAAIPFLYALRYTFLLSEATNILLLVATAASVYQ